eukprot:4663923-Amphidinium_carterae.2
MASMALMDQTKHWHMSVYQLEATMRPLMFLHPSIVPVVPCALCESSYIVWLVPRMRHARPLQAKTSKEKRTFDALAAMDADVDGMDNSSDANGVEEEEHGGPSDSRSEWGQMNQKLRMLLLEPTLQNQADNVGSKRRCFEDRAENLGSVLGDKAFTVTKVVMTGQCNPALFKSDFVEMLKEGFDIRCTGLIGAETELDRELVVLNRTVRIGEVLPGQDAHDQVVCNGSRIDRDWIHIELQCCYTLQEWDNEMRLLGTRDRQGVP